MTKDRSGVVRFGLGFVLPLVLVGGTLFPVFWFGERLPDPIATHWGIGGRANDSMSFAFHVAFILIFSGVPAAIVARIARRTPAYRGEIAPAVGFSTFAATVMMLASWGIVRANLDVGNWTEARGVGFAGIGGALAAAVVMAVGAARLARTLETAGTREPVVPRAGLGPGERAIWVGTARAVWAPILVAVFVGAAMVSAVAVHPLFGLIFGVIGLTGLGFTSIRVIADRHGVRIRYGALGWPTQRIPLADIGQASAIQVVPMQRGGWGYRGSLRLFGRAAVVLRGGEGIQLDLVGGRRLVITVDGAETGAGVINDLVSAGAAP